MSPPAVSTIIFDLGGVLFELSGARLVCEWTRERLTPAELLEKWLASPAVRDFECGRIDFAVFRARLKEELELQVSDDIFTDAFAGWITGAYPGAEELLQALSARYRLACLSNTNAFHWDILEREYDLLPLFDHVFASFRMGLVKPDPDAFDHVVTALDRPAGSLAFFDDSRANVEAALSCGLRAFRVDGVNGVRRVLREEGLL